CTGGKEVYTRFGVIVILNFHPNCLKHPDIFRFVMCAIRSLNPRLIPRKGFALVILEALRLLRTAMV
ncbi:hypothetical protein EDD56_1201, partial [Pseudobacteriovorax antillogorgiicola]